MENPHGFHYKVNLHHCQYNLKFIEEFLLDDYLPEQGKEKVNLSIPLIYFVDLDTYESISQVEQVERWWFRTQN